MGKAFMNSMEAICNKIQGVCQNGTISQSSYKKIPAADI